MYIHMYMCVCIIYILCIYINVGFRKWGYSKSSNIRPFCPWTHGDWGSHILRNPMWAIPFLSFWGLLHYYTLYLLYIYTYIYTQYI